MAFHFSQARGLLFLSFHRLDHFLFNYYISVWIFFLKLLYTLAGIHFLTNLYQTLLPFQLRLRLRVVHFLLIQAHLLDFGKAIDASTIFIGTILLWISSLNILIDYLSILNQVKFNIIIDNRNNKFGAFISISIFFLDKL